MQGASSDAVSGRVIQNRGWWARWAPRLGEYTVITPIPDAVRACDLATKGLRLLFLPFLLRYAELLKGISD